MQCVGVYRLCRAGAILKPSRDGSLELVCTVNLGNCQSNGPSDPCQVLSADKPCHLVNGTWHITGLLRNSLRAPESHTCRYAPSFNMNHLNCKTRRDCHCIWSTRPDLLYIVCSWTRVPTNTIINVNITHIILHLLLHHHYQHHRQVQYQTHNNNIIIIIFNIKRITTRTRKNIH